MAAWIRNPMLPVALAVMLIIIIFFDFFVPKTSVAAAASTLEAWVVIMVAVITWVGLIQVVRVAGSAIMRRAAGRWPLSIYQICLTFLMLGAGFNADATTGLWERDPIVSWLYTNYFSWGDFALNSVMGFFVVESAYRAFKARSGDAIIFMLAAIFSMVGSISIGGLIWTGFPEGTIWLQMQIFNPVIRAITIATGIGIVAYLIRFVIGREIGALGAMEEQ